MLLDDPFVDLDPGRRSLAGELLREVGETMQVLVLTCHEPHATALGDGRIECRDAP